MKKLIAKVLLVGLPVLFSLFVYIYNDPFKVIYHYDAYLNPHDSFYYENDWDFISTQTLIQNYDKYQYDSYIFGSSRSNYYAVKEWERYINSNRAYHFSANYESLYGVEKKFEFIEKQKYKIRNALIIMDNELLSVVTNGKGHLTLKHPALSGQSRINFQINFLADFFDKNFLIQYTDLFLSGHPKPYMFKSQVFQHFVSNYDVATNELSIPAQEARIEADSTQYYAEKADIFYARDSVQHYGAAIIGAEQLKMLTNVKRILTENNVNYRIVISPLYDQVKLNTADLAALQNIFGKENVFDFSGINAITNNKYNYYENSHYRYKVSDYIMKCIYSNSAPM